MQQKLPEEVEEYYSQGMVDTASVARVVLVLYERLLLLLKRALVSGQDLPAMLRYLAHAQVLLTHLLKVFLQSKDKHYRELYTDHERIARQLAALFLQRPLPFDLLQSCYQDLESYFEAWEQQLQIRHHLPEPRPISLNVKRCSEDSPESNTEVKA
ncbi:MAG: hypothetical protein ACAI44_08140 [Candidatus Sericytochromatia bacterium]